MGDQRIETLRQKYNRLDELSRNIKSKLGRPYIKEKEKEKDRIKEEYEKYKRIIYPRKYGDKQKKVGQIIQARKDQQVQVEDQVNQKTEQQSMEQQEQQEQFMKSEEWNDESCCLDIDQIVEQSLQNSEENKEIQKLLKEQESIQQSLKKLEYYEQPIQQNYRRGSMKQLTGQLIKEWDSIEKGDSGRKVKQMDYKLERIDEES